VWSALSPVEVGGKYSFGGHFRPLSNTELERYLAKVRVASSSLVSRSTPLPSSPRQRGRGWLGCGRRAAGGQSGHSADRLTLRLRGPPSWLRCGVRLFADDAVWAETPDLHIVSVVRDACVGAHRMTVTPAHRDVWTEIHHGGGIWAHSTARRGVLLNRLDDSDHVPSPQIPWTGG
jgi:hypothetical protein